MARHRRPFGKRPVVPGSSITNNQLRRIVNRGAGLKYAGAEHQATQNLQRQRQIESDTGDYYNQYLQQLAANQASTQGYQKQAADAAAGLATATSALPVTQSTDMSPEALADAAKAAGVRGTLAQSFGALTNIQGANANTYASNLAHVVAPGQKLQAVKAAQGQENKIRSDIQALKGEKGTYKATLADQLRQDESKNVLARQIAGINADLSSQRLGETVRSHKVSEKLARKRIKQSAKNATSRGYGPGAPGLNKFGYTYDQWTAMTPKQQADARKTSSGKAPATQAEQDFFKKYGVKPQSTNQHNTAKTSVSRAQLWFRRVKQSAPNMTPAQIGQLLTTGQAGIPAVRKNGKIVTPASPAIPKMDPLFVRVAMDLAATNGKGIYNGTADRLHKAGYSVGLLGLRSVGPVPPPKPRPPAQSIPLIGGQVG